MQDFKSKNKRTNQFLIHATLIISLEKTEKYEIVALKRGHDVCIALIVDEYVQEIHTRDQHDFQKFRNSFATRQDMTDLVKEEYFGYQF